MASSTTPAAGSTRSGRHRGARRGLLRRAEERPGSRVVPAGFDAVARAALVDDGAKTVSAVRALARQHAQNGVTWPAFRTDLEYTWRALGRLRPPRSVVKAAASAWPEPRRGRAASA